MDSTYHHVHLKPLDRSFQVADGTPLIDVLHEYGIEFPCGGKGTCGACKVQVVGGDIKLDEAHQQALDQLDLSGGWRLACMSRVTQDITLEVGQWQTFILADNSPFEFIPREGYGIAVDLGTTTLVAQLVDLQKGRVINAATAANPQGRYGGDVMSRVEYAVTHNTHQMTRLIRGAIYKLMDQLLSGHSLKLEKIVLVGNTVMHHLFCDLDLTPLATYPFEGQDKGPQSFTPSSLGWTLPGDPQILFIPPVGGFVGSDILAGILASRMHQKQSISCLIDLGTNGEIVAGNLAGMVCASTAAGPAFEGTNISMGMTATTGALASFDGNHTPLQYHIIGNESPRGICGSGLIDSVAWLQQSGQMDMWGKLTDERERIEVVPGIAITQQDIREVQLAKAAIAAGIHIVSKKAGADPAMIQEVFLAGAFGTYLNLANARHMGLIEFEEGKVTRLGNSALIGAKMLLYYDWESIQPLFENITHISLETDPGFQELYAMNMLFEV